MVKNRVFKHLHVPDHWEQYWSKYPQGYTILEALINWLGQVNDMVDSYNELTEEFKKFKDSVGGDLEDFEGAFKEFIDSFDGNLKETVQDILTEWKESGFLEIIISEALELMTEKIRREVFDIGKTKIFRM